MCRKTTFYISLNSEMDVVEEVYYLKQVFHLLCDKSVTPAEAFLFLNIIDENA